MHVTKAFYQLSVTSRLAPDERVFKRFVFFVYIAKLTVFFFSFFTCADLLRVQITFTQENNFTHNKK